MLNDNDLQKTIDVLKRSQSVIITSHIRPDGDSCGSIMAMTRVLRSMGKKSSADFIKSSRPVVRISF